MCRDFSRIHPIPQTSQDVPDDRDARLVVLGIEHPHAKEQQSAALDTAKLIFETRGNMPRNNRNTLVFLAADKIRLQELYDATSRYLAWVSILSERIELDLSPFQVKQAETQKNNVEGAVVGRIPETYQWLIVPVQATPQEPVEWQSIRLTGQEALAERASKKLRNDELLVTAYGATRLRMELDSILFRRGNSISIKQLIEDYARYLYLPRLKNSDVLLSAIRDGLAMPTWEQDTFAYAESYDEISDRYRGLRGGKESTIVYDSEGHGLLVKADVARRQIDTEIKAQTEIDGKTESVSDDETQVTDIGKEDEKKDDKETIPRPKRYHGSVELDPERVGYHASQIGDEVIKHLVGLVSAGVKVTLEIEAEIPDGTPENIVRTVTENSRTLKFISHGFEEE